MNKVVENLTKNLSFIEENGAFPLEKEFINVDKEATSRFNDIYGEVTNKESDELVQLADTTFLIKSIKEVLESKDNYLYVESKNFEIVRMESLVLEIDDLFGTYEAIFGLFAPKKAVNEIKEYFKGHKFSIMFNDADGLWEVNLALDNLEDFHMDNTLEQTLEMIYNYILKLQTIL